MSHIVLSNLSMVDISTEKCILQNNIRLARHRLGCDISAELLSAFSHYSEFPLPVQKSLHWHFSDNGIWVGWISWTGIASQCPVLLTWVQITLENSSLDTLQKSGDRSRAGTGAALQEEFMTLSLFLHNLNCSDLHLLHFLKWSLGHISNAECGNCMIWSINLAEADLFSTSHTEKCCCDLHCPGFAGEVSPAPHADVLSHTQQKSGWRKRGNFCLHALVLSQAIIFSICHIVFSAHLEAQTVLRKRTKKFRCRLAVCAAVRGSLEESLGGLVFCMASSLAAHTRHLQGFQILPARAAFQGRSRTGIQPTTLQDLGHPVAAVFISEEAVLPDTCFSSYLLLCFFFTALISWKQYKLCQVSQAFEKSRFS